MDDSDEISIQVKSLTEEAINHMVLGDNTRSLKCYRTAFKLSLDAASSQQVLSCACNYGASCIVNSKTDEAIDLLEEYLNKVVDVENEDHNFYSLIGDVHYNLALAYNIKYQFEDSIRHLNSAIQIFEGHKLIKPLAESYQQLADVCIKSGRREQAVGTYRKAARIFRQTENIISEGKIYIKLAKLYSDAKENEKCMKQLIKCDKLCDYLKKDKQNGVTSKSIRLMYDLARAYKTAKETDKALEWLEHADDTSHLIRPTKDEVKLHAVLAQDIGKMYIERGNYNNAVEKYQKAASLYGQLGNMKSRAWCFYHLGGIFLMLKDSLSSEKNYHVAYQMLEDAGNMSHLWKIKEGLGDLQAVTYQYTSSVTYYKEALTFVGVCRSRKVLNDQKRIVDKLTTVLDAQRNGGKRDFHVSYDNRKPVILPMNIESSLEYSQVGLPPMPARVTGPATSTPLTSTPFISIPLAEKCIKSRDSKKKSRKKKGRKRSDLLNPPVPSGVSGYDSGSDLSLVAKEMQKRLNLSFSLESRRSNSLPKDLENHTYELPDDGRALKQQFSASQEALKRDSSQEEQTSSSKDEMKNERRKSWMIFRKWQSSSCSETSRSSESESTSMESHKQSTSEIQTIPMYATIDQNRAGKIGTSTLDSVNGNMSSTMPSREAPEPPPTLPTMRNHPSVLRQNGHHSEDTTFEEEKSASESTTSSISKLQRDSDLYEVARHEEEVPKSVEPKRFLVRGSRMCLVM